MRQDIDVLVADDSDSDAELTLEALRRAVPAALVARVKDGADALRFLFAIGGYAGRAAMLPRLVLLDVHMPIIDGLGVLKIIQGHPLTDDIPVVLLSSSANPLLVERGKLLGAKDYRIKLTDFASYCAEISDVVSAWLPGSVPPLSRVPDSEPTTQQLD